MEIEIVINFISETYFYYSTYWKKIQVIPLNSDISFITYKSSIGLNSNSLYDWGGLSLLNLSQLSYVAQNNFSLNIFADHFWP